MLRTEDSRRQRRLFCCSCGAVALWARGLCRPCYHARYRSQRYFGGLREQVLARDGGRCQVCGQPTNVVHHRRPGQNRLEWLVSVCPGHHAVLTRLLFLHRWVPSFLRTLWREQHPHAPERFCQIEVQSMLYKPVSKPPA